MKIRPVVDTPPIQPTPPGGDKQKASFDIEVADPGACTGR